MRSDSEDTCVCGDPLWVSHNRWYICGNCKAWLPPFDKPGAVAFARRRIAEGRASVARELRTQ